MEYLKYINIGIYVLFGIIVLVRLLWGIKAGLLKSLIRLAGTVCALVATFATFALIFKIAEPSITETIDKAIASDESMAIINQLDASKESIVALMEGLVGPLLFLALFVCWNTLFAIVSLVIRCVVKLIPIKSGLISRLGGAGVSVITGLLVFFIIMMPFAGYSQKAPEVYAEAVSSGVATEDESVTLVMDGLKNEGFAFGGLTATLTEPVFTFSSSVKIKDGTKINSFKEVKSVLKLVPKLEALGNLDFSDMSKVDLTAINEVVDGASDSDLLSIIVSEVLSKAGTNWKEGKEFLGVNIKEEIAKSAPGCESAIDGVLEKLAGCTKNNMSSVIKDFTKAIKSVASMVKYLEGANNADPSTGTVTNAQDLAEVLKDLDESTVDMILPAVSEEVMKGAGLNDDEAKLVSSVLSDTLTEVAKMSDEEIDAEAAAIDTLLNCTGENAEPDPDEVISALIESKVVLTAVKTVVDEMPEESEAILGSVSEEQKSAISSALDDYKAENPDASQEKIDIIKSLFGITD